MRLERDQHLSDLLLEIGFECGLPGAYVYRDNIRIFLSKVPIIGIRGRNYEHRYQFETVEAIDALQELPPDLQELIILNMELFV
tara:strand:+ start:997 stop:1248 length:252 start_codon:yes stop_codon:yes gene_type:complete